MEAQVSVEVQVLMEIQVSMEIQVPMGVQVPMELFYAQVSQLSGFYLRVWERLRCSKIGYG